MGPEFGAAIGIIFYAANVVGGAVYLIGFVEALVAQFGLPDEHWYVVLYAGIALVILTGICFVGADMVSKANGIIFTVLMICVAMSFASFMFQKDLPDDGYSPPSQERLQENAIPIFSEGLDFFAVFAIVFPAVTGIMAGANMSGDLRTPSKSIPRGTLAALGFSAFVYYALCVLMAMTLDAEIASTNNGYSIMATIAFVPELITVGIFCAVLSSAMGAIIGSAKILQALARDDLIPMLHPFAQGSKGKDEPERAVILSFTLILLILISTSDLNLIASFQSLFFILSYAVTNLACLILSVTGSVAFRPTWRYHSWQVSAFGLISCIALMFLSNPVEAGLCFAMLFVLVVFVLNRNTKLKMNRIMIMEAIMNMSMKTKYEYEIWLWT